MRAVVRAKESFVGQEAKVAVVHSGGGVVLAGVDECPLRSSVQVIVKRIDSGGALQQVQLFRGRACLRQFGVGIDDMAAQNLAECRKPRP